MNIMHRRRPKRKLAATTLVLFLAAAASPSGFARAAEAASLLTSGIQFASTNHNFGSILAGEPVKHDFLFTNTGGQDLIITKVQPGCGCTRAGDWTRITHPGQTGNIPIQLNSAGFVGVVDKTIDVTCNDPSRPALTLQLRGTVQRAMEIQPSVAILNLQPDSPFGRVSIHITNDLERPLWLSAPRSTNQSLGAELHTNLPGRDYSVIVSNTAPLPPGALAANLTIDTSLTNLPSINLLTLANVSPTFTTLPGQIHLAPTPLATNQVVSIIILSHSTNAVSVSAPALSVGGVTVALRETKPGEAFAAVLAFPAGFQWPAGQPHSFSFKTTHPQCPVVEVPVCQGASGLPPAPLLPSTAAEPGTAPLPLVFRAEGLRALRLSEEQLEAIAQLRTQFIEEIGGLGQNPSDPAYLARWRKAQPKADGMLIGLIGRNGVMRLDQVAPPSDSGTD